MLRGSDDNFVGGVLWTYHNFEGLSPKGQRARNPNPEDTESARNEHAAGAPIARTPDRVGTDVPAAAVPVRVDRPEGALAVLDVSDIPLGTIGRHQELVELTEEDFLLVGTELIANTLIPRVPGQFVLTQSGCRHVPLDLAEEIRLEVSAEVSDGDFPTTPDNELLGDDELIHRDGLDGTDEAEKRRHGHNGVRGDNLVCSAG